MHESVLRDFLTGRQSAPMLKKDLAGAVVQTSSDVFTQYLTGVLLVYQDSEKTLSGIYVDRAKIDSVSGSGVSVEPWGDCVGWLVEKKRSSIK